jgi:hypothetical protein
MKKTLKMSLAILGLFGSLGMVNAYAGSLSDVSVGLQVGTLGAGVVAAVPLTKDVAARIGVNGYNYNYNTTSNGVAYDGHLKLQSAEFFADWHPWGGSFRLTGGVLYNNNKFDLTGTPSGGSYTFNGTVYTASQVGSVNANVDFNKVAPYIGFGWGDNSQTAGLHFTSDIGVAYQGSPKATITATGAASNAQLASDVQASQAKLQSDLNNFRFYPVIEMGLVYRF